MFAAVAGLQGSGDRVGHIPEGTGPGRQRAEEASHLAHQLIAPAPVGMTTEHVADLMTDDSRQLVL